MKKLLVLTLVGASSLAAFAQGKIDFGNNLGSTTFRAPISGTVPSNPAQSIIGQGSGSLYFPTGSTSYQGATFLTGTGFTMALFAGPSSVVDPNALTLVTAVPFRTGSGAGFITTAVGITVPGVDAGQQAKFQIRAWDNLGGTVTTWAAALANPNVASGVSQMVTSGALGGTDAGGNLFPTNPSTTGWTSFNIYLVPEPSTFVLAGLGAAGLLIFRRRK